jgi:phospholipid transport system substrate-binding protein
LRDVNYRDVAHRGNQREEIWALLREIFDFKELAKEALGRDWRRFTPPQRMDFTNVFAEFLGNMFLAKLDGKYQDAKVVYLSEKTSSDSKTVVRTEIHSDTKKTAVDYRMRKHNGGWRVYDVNIKGVSLMKLYRAQFQKILSKKSPKHLIERLKEKTERQEKAASRG